MRFNPRNIVRLYIMNRLWGDTMLEAAYWALRGKAFLASFEGHLIEEQITESQLEAAWWQAIK
jgi:hypothetical protein